MRDEGGDVLRGATAVARLGERGEPADTADVTMSAITSTQARARGVPANGRGRPAAAKPRGLTADECATVLSTCLRPRRAAPDTASSARRPLSDAAWSTVQIVVLRFHGALRRSEVAALCWADVDFSDGDDVVVTVRR